ncbi:putative PAR1 protein [Tanacetum coccineum]|uniref:PAR1 protein n=1 Tax=Tanacetum coccineum TaxID=301880 RepID=A0ABQ5F5T2_9ASTR
MDSSNLLKTFLVCAVISAFSVQATLGSIACENLNKDSCAFAVSSGGKRSCGLNRNVLGISSDSLLESKFTQKLCSTQCYNGCPNIVDLYFNLAAGEEIRSSGFVAPGPVEPVKLLTDGSPIMALSPAGSY